MPSVLAETPKVLLIGLDGGRFDTLRKAATPIAIMPRPHKRLNGRIAYTAGLTKRPAGLAKPSD
ncbi:hypothetical protein Pla52o_51360 [Novipirellula galeiformis]|uniref:Uncharacterized protein n=1 Tax=Novipirellula galeiformis TaxID=2528004 RepID=A0A5C6BZ28_9BACT|nr:hypothetical protein [Novipirellula galeiformis]TWU17580.1 hypothetical protein Pla52o_51360 [Novipirellula galeiformis]